MGKRLGIFAIYNAGGRVEQYVTYLLENLKTCCQTLIIVCNGAVLEEEAERLWDYADEIFYRQNVGFDCGAIRDVLMYLYGWDRVLYYDELLIMNDTCYGPIYPLEDVFLEMEQRIVDFWGITEQLPLYVDEEIWGKNLLPYHIQSYFVVFRRNLLHHPCFRSFWENLKLSDAYYETIKNYELRMTPYFCEKGFHADAYIHEEEGTEGCYLFNRPYYLVKEKKLPFIKRKSIMFRPDGYLPFFSMLERERLFSYLEERKLYDLLLIREDFEHRYGTQSKEELLDKKVSVHELREFRKNNKFMMVYGAGVFACLVIQTLEEEGIPFDGYVVSDGYRKKTEKNGKKIYELSELSEKREEIGIVLGVEKKTCEKIVRNLDALRFRNIFAI